MSISYLLLLLLSSVIFSPTKQYDFDKYNTNKVKGIFAILIVLYHAWGVVDKYWGVVIVSMFFFFSGYGLMKTYSYKGDAYLESFCRKRFVKLLPPLLLVTLGFMAVWSFFGHGDLHNWIAYFIQTGIPPIGATWYVYCSIPLYLIFFISMSLGKKNIYQIALLVILTLIYIGIIKYIFKWDYFWWCSVFAFIVGVLYSNSEYSILRKVKNQHSFRKIILILTITLLALIFWHHYNSQLATLCIFINLLPITVVFIVYHFGVPDNRFISYVGGLSYEIYIVHDAYISFLYTFGLNSSFLRFLIVFALTLPTALLLNKVCKIATKKLLS